MLILQGEKAAGKIGENPKVSISYHNARGGYPIIVEDDMGIKEET